MLVIGSGVATAAIFNDAPVTGFADSLARAGQDGSVGALPSLRTAYYEFYDDRAMTVLLTALARGIGFIAIALMLAYLASAVRSRTDAFKGYWIYVALVGGVGGAVATVLFTLGTSAEISGFLDGSRTVDRADAIGDSSLLVTAQLIGIPGTQAIGLASLAMGLAWVVICLNAMRIGLLTRFMGVLGRHLRRADRAPDPVPAADRADVLARRDGAAAGRPLAERDAARVGDRRGAAVAERGRAARGAPEGRGPAPRPLQPEPEPEPEPATPAGPSDGRAHPASRKKKRKRRT